MKHTNIFLRAGFTTARQFRYWKQDSFSVNIEGLLSDLNEAPKDSVVILQACGHNPTGFDPSRAEWMKIADVIEKQQLFPFFHCYCQGLASGDIDVDAWPVRYFADRGFEFMCAQSFSANFGLYGKQQPTRSDPYTVALTHLELWEKNYSYLIFPHSPLGD